MKKTPLKVKTPLKAKTKISKTSKTPIGKLRKEAWTWFSRYVRIRDTEYGEEGWYGTCITCSKHGLIVWHDGKKLRFTKGWDAGHYIGRGNWYLLFDEENVNLQCAFRCNKMNSGEHEKYKVALDNKYGDGTHAKLDALATEHPGHSYRHTREELEQIISDCKTYLDYYEKMG